MNKQELIKSIAITMYPNTSMTIAEEVAQSAVTLCADYYEQLAIEAINSESVITNPRARKNAVQSIREAFKCLPS